MSESAKTAYNDTQTIPEKGIDWSIKDRGLHNPGSSIVGDSFQDRDSSSWLESIEKNATLLRQNMAAQASSSWLNSIERNRGDTAIRENRAIHRENVAIHRSSSTKLQCDKVVPKLRTNDNEDGDHYNDMVAMVASCKQRRKR